MFRGPSTLYAEPEDAKEVNGINLIIQENTATPAENTEIGAVPVLKEIESDDAPLASETKALFTALEALAPATGIGWDEDTLVDELELCLDWFNTGKDGEITAKFNAICARREKAGKWFPGKTCNKAGEH